MLPHDVEARRGDRRPRRAYFDNCLCDGLRRARRSRPSVTIAGVAADAEQRQRRKRTTASALRDLVTQARSWKRSFAVAVANVANPESGL